MLQFYDPTKPIKLSSDASKNGLGAVIMQLHDNQWKPVAYAARAMIDAETRYAQIEKELLSIVFACERFHQFIYGASVEAETDHKPLITLFTKPLNQCPLRVQRMMLRLQKYDLNVYYTPGKYLVTADALSRSVSNQTATEKESLVDAVQLWVDTVVTTMPISDHRMSEIQRETQRDPELLSVMQAIVGGWPANRANCRPEIAPFWGVRAQLSTAHGLILNGTRVVIPRTLRKATLSKIHEGHMGIEKCKRRARDHVYWPGINTHIQEMVTACSECQTFRPSNVSEPLQPHQIPTKPWQKIGADLFSHEGKNYLVMVDYASGYPELMKMSTTTSSAKSPSLQDWVYLTLFVVIMDLSSQPKNLRTLPLIGTLNM